MQLTYAPLEAYRQADQLPRWDRLAAYAALNRLNALYMIQRAGAGHIGGSFSAMDIITYMHLEHPEIAFFSSKGHDAPAFYASLIATGVIPFEMLHTLRRRGGLPGHPELGTPGIVAHSGSLGMGISKAKGLIRANRLRGIQQRVCVLLGDGELQEGQVWEAIYAGDGFKELLCIVDGNGFSTERRLKQNYSSLWQRFDGHAFAEIERILNWAPEWSIVSAAVAKTVKGKGVSFMENKPEYHSGALFEDEYERAVRELQDSILHYLPGCPFLTEKIIPHRRLTNSLRLAYEDSLLNCAYSNPNLVVLDADLAEDCGLLQFREHFPDRFIECGIAEQDMVSQAGMLAAQGFVPIVHSFAAFLCRRANEQIYDNCHQALKVIYVGAMAGRLPDGPGPSHEALDDIALMQTMPYMEVLEPLTPDEVEVALNYAVNQAEGPVYIRLAANPVERMRL